MILKFNRVQAIVKVHVRTKFHQAEYISYRAHKLLRPILQWQRIRKSGPVALVFDYNLQILWVSSSCQDTRSCKISQSRVQQFTSYRGHRKEEKL